MYLKIHNSKNQTIVAACDAAILGKILEEGEKFLDLRTHQDFYKGTKITELDLRQALKNFDSANLVGEKVINIAVSCSLVKQEEISYINGYPYIQIYRI
ncbi:DUF424 family protein [Candidatus Micrarchaeota archaeon]|nr:DUF424 family protein [Candidatus Micrarchaeota archaeon]